MQEQRKKKKGIDQYRQTLFVPLYYIRGVVKEGRHRASKGRVTRRFLLNNGGLTIEGQGTKVPVKGGHFIKLQCNTGKVMAETMAPALQVISSARKAMIKSWPFVGG